MQYNGYTPLMYAVKDNKIQIVERMLELGCDMVTRNKVSVSTRSQQVDQIQSVK